MTFQKTEDKYGTYFTQTEPSACVPLGQAAEEERKVKEHLKGRRNFVI